MQMICIVSLIMAIMLAFWNHINQTYASVDRVEGLGTRLDRIEMQLDRVLDKLP